MDQSTFAGDDGETRNAAMPSVPPHRPEPDQPSYAGFPDPDENAVPGTAGPLERGEDGELVPATTGAGEPDPRSFPDPATNPDAPEATGTGAPVTEGGMVATEDAATREPSTEDLPAEPAPATDTEPVVDGEDGQ